MTTLTSAPAGALEALAAPVRSDAPETRSAAAAVAFEQVMDDALGDRRSPPAPRFARTALPEATLPEATLPEATFPEVTFPEVTLPASEGAPPETPSLERARLPATAPVAGPKAEADLSVPANATLEDAQPDSVTLVRPNRVAPGLVLAPESAAGELAAGPEHWAPDTAAVAAPPARAKDETLEEVSVRAQATADPRVARPQPPDTRAEARRISPHEAPPARCDQPHVVSAFASPTVAGHSDELPWGPTQTTPCDRRSAARAMEKSPPAASEDGGGEDGGGSAGVVLARDPAAAPASPDPAATACASLGSAPPAAAPQAAQCAEPAGLGGRAQASSVPSELRPSARGRGPTRRAGLAEGEPAAVAPDGVLPHGRPRWERTAGEVVSVAVADAKMEAGIPDAPRPSQPPWRSQPPQLRPRTAAAASVGPQAGGASQEHGAGATVETSAHPGSTTAAHALEAEVGHGRKPVPAVAAAGLGPVSAELESATTGPSRRVVASARHESAGAHRARPDSTIEVLPRPTISGFAAGVPPEPSRATGAEPALAATKYAHLVQRVESAAGVVPEAVGATRAGIAAAATGDRAGSAGRTAGAAADPRRALPGASRSLATVPAPTSWVMPVGQALTTPPGSGSGRSDGSKLLRVGGAVLGRWSSSREDTAGLSAGAAPPTGGTPAAPQVDAMNKPDQTSRFCRAEEKNLPGLAPSRTERTAEVVAPRGGLALADAPEMSRTREERGPAEMLFWPALEVARMPLDDALAARPMGTAAALPALPLATLVEDQIVQFRQLTAASMAVLLKPDVRTEMFLQLVRRDGQIEVFARCERGDLAALQADWSQLQGALAQHGIRLAPLNETAPLPQEAVRPGAPPPSSSPSTSPDAHERSSRRPPNPLDDLPMVGSLTEPLRRRATRPVPLHRRGWESWA